MVIIGTTYFIKNLYKIKLIELAIYDSSLKPNLLLCVVLEFVFLQNEPVDPLSGDSVANFQK